MAVAAVYARFSSAGQRDESIEDQVRVCTEAAAAAGDDAALVYADRAATGTSTERRPEFMRMVSDAQRGLFQTVYVYKLDRFARNRYDSAVYKARLRKAGVRLVSATERIEDGPDGILLESLLEGMAEYYSANLSQNVRRGLEGNAMRCRHNGVRLFGYELGEDGYYREEPAEAAAVRKAFGMYLGGAGFPEIVDALAHVRTKMGNRISMQMVGNMLRNEKYRGTYRFGSTVVEHGMPALVSDEDFAAVQERLARRTRRRAGTMDYLLTGKLFDADGNRYQSNSGHGHAGRKYTYYRCPATGHSVPQHEMEDAVARAAEAVIRADDEAVANIVADVLAAQDAAVADDLAAASALERRLAQNEREQARVVELAAKTGAVDAVAAKLRDLAAEHEAVESELADARAACPVLDAGQVEFWVRRVMGRSDPLEAVRLFVRRVTVDRATGELRLEFTFDGVGGRATKEPPPDAPDGGSDDSRVVRRTGFEPVTF